MPTALIVEDEPEANELLAMLVRLRGYETDSAFSGAEALHKADDQHPDILFLDLMLPDITGYDVCNSLKARRATNDIPIVMVTARDAEENRRKGIRAGAMEYIPKPYTPDQIFQAMNEADAWRRQIDALEEQGRFGIDPRNDVAAFQHVSDLRSLLLARTRADETAITKLGQSLSEILQRGLDWGRKRKVDHIGSVSYRLEPQQITVNVLDESGWFKDDRPNEDGLAVAIADGAFNQVDFDPTALQLILTTRFG